MDFLAAQPSHPSKAARVRGVVAWEIREAKSNQTLAVTHDDALVAYQLDTLGRPQGEKMADGVLVGRIDGRSIVCFVELKCSLKDSGTGTRAARGLAQLDAAINHFHPAQRAASPRPHGDDHHDAWTRGDDQLAVMPAPNHEVIALVVGYRSVPRLPPAPPQVVGRTTVYSAVVQVAPAVANRAEVSFANLLRLAGR